MEAVCLVVDCGQTASAEVPGGSFLARSATIQTDIHTEFFFIVLLGLWEASKLTKKILARSEKITDRIHYGIICPEFFGHIKRFL